jgi:hypothetical protein
VALVKLRPPHSHSKKILLELLWLLPGLVFYGLFRLAFLWPAFTETVYSRGVFRAVGQALSVLTGWLPISLGELLLYAFVLFVAVHLMVTLVRAILAKKDWWYVVLRRVIALLGAASFLYALFVGLWGFNYARQPLSESLGLNAAPATVQELYSTCEALIREANALRALVPEDNSGVFAPDETREQIMRSVPSYYDRAAMLTGNGWLSGSFGRAKPVLYSIGLSYSHISGVYFPFTGEANVNADAPMLGFASACNHEAAHQRGFAREDEANFLSYYVCTFSDNPSVRYSGAMLALIHAMDQLYDADSDLYFELRGAYSEGINRDLDANSAYWRRFDSPVSDTAQQVNNTFLKANMQQDGVKSYGRMVDLLIGLWRAGGISPAAPETPVAG